MMFPYARHGGVMVIDAGRELSLRSCDDFKQVVRDKVNEGERQFVIDFAGTEFIDSAGLGALISVSKLVNSREGSIRLMRLNDEMKRLFELTKLDTLFDVVGSQSPAEQELELPDTHRRGAGVERPGPAH